MKAPGSCQSREPQYSLYMPCEGPPPQMRTTATIMKTTIADSLRQAAQNSSSAYPRAPKMLTMIIRTRNTWGDVSTGSIKTRCHDCNKTAYSHPDSHVDIRSPILNDSSANSELKWQNKSPLHHVVPTHGETPRWIDEPVRVPACLD